MKPTFACLLAVSLLWQCAYAQNTYQFLFPRAGYYSSGVIPAADDGTIATHNRAGNCGNDVKCRSYLSAQHFDKNGNPVWSKNYVTGYSVTGGLSAATADGGFAMLGRVYDTATQTYRGGLLLKCNRNGSLLWAKQVVSSRFSAFAPQLVAEDNDGNLLVIYLVTNGTDYNASVLQVTKVSAKGALIWNSTGVLADARSPNYFDINSFFQSGNRYYLYGETNNQYFEGLYNADLIVMDTGGVVVKSKKITSTSATTGYIEDVYAGSVYVKDKVLYVTGGCAESSGTHGFTVPVPDTATTSKGFTYEFTFLCRQYLAKKFKTPLPLRMYGNIYLDRQGSLIELMPAAPGSLMTKYDTLGRICPDYSLPKIDTTLTRKVFNVNDEVYITRTDTVRLLDVAVEVSSQVLHDSIICSSVAPAQGFANDRMMSTATGSTAAPRIGVYPNPAGNVVHISGMQQNGSVVVYSSLGNVVKMVLITSSYPVVPVAGLPGGVYFLKVMEKGKAPVVVSFIKE